MHTTGGDVATNSTQLARQRLASISAAFAGTREYKAADGTVRHKCFLSYHAADAVEALAFVEAFDSVFIPKCIGVTADDPWIESDNTDYVLDKVREKYLTDSTVTIVLVGACTWARRFVDWEIYSSLRKDKLNRLNGLIAVQLHSAALAGASLPARVSDNVTRVDGKNVGYARYYSYPNTTRSLQSWIEDAFQARTSRPNLRVNNRARRLRNASC